jgi:type I site-specific restriction endonuclease
MNNELPFLFESNGTEIYFTDLRDTKAVLDEFLHSIALIF